MRIKINKCIKTKDATGQTNGFLVPLYNVHEGFHAQGMEPQHYDKIHIHIEHLPLEASFSRPCPRYTFVQGIIGKVQSPKAPPQ